MALSLSKVLRHWLATCAVFGVLTSFAVAADSEATHKQIRAIVPEMNGREAHLNTFCVGPDNNLYMCCTPNAQPSSANVLGAVLVYSGEGKLLKEIELEFAPQAINFGSDSTMFVAGSGKVAKISPKGEVLLVKEAPNVGNKEEMMAQLKEAAEKQSKQVLESYTRQIEQIDKQIAKLEKEAAEAKEKEATEDTEKATKRRERRLKLLNQQKEQFESIADNFKESFQVQSDDSALARLMRSTGLAVSKEDVFVSLPMAAGYGYGIWRMNHDLEEPKLVVEDVGGCCGQLDIQSDGEHLLIAENTAFQVGFYDRDGKRLNGWGKRGRNEPDGFGSCCNPMNVRCCSNGEILTAESSIGDIKRFSAEGEFLGLVGRASVGGGCKHVALGWDSSRNWHYMMNQDRSHVAVLVPNDQAPNETEEERISREALEGLGKKLLGTWEMVTEKSGKKADADENGPIEMDNYLTQMYGHMEFAGDGSFISSPIQAAKKQAARSSTTKSVKKTETATESESTEATKGEAKSVPALVLIPATKTDVVEEEQDADVDLNGAITMAASKRNSKWKALQQRDNEIDFVTIEEDVQGYGATVKFVSDDEITLTWFYGAPNLKMSEELRYKLISKDACGQKCETEKCEEKDKEGESK
jgi:hypothetical protein